MVFKTNKASGLTVLWPPCNEQSEEQKQAWTQVYSLHQRWSQIVMSWL